MAKRPLGISVFSLLGMLRGFIIMAAGAMLVAGGAFLATGNQYLAMILPGAAMGIVIGFAGLAAFAIGLLVFLIYFGLFRMNVIAFWIVFLVEAVSLLVSLATIAIHDYSAVWGTIWSVAVVAYLWAKRGLFR